MVVSFFYYKDTKKIRKPFLFGASGATNHAPKVLEIKIFLLSLCKKEEKEWEEIIESVNNKG